MLLQNCVGKLLCLKKKKLVLFLAIREAMAPLANNLIMLGRSIQLIRHLENQNWVIILDDISRYRMLWKSEQKKKEYFRYRRGLLASSLEYPQRIEWSQSLNRLSVCLSVLCSLSVWLSANFLIFPSFILLFLYSTVQKSAVQYSIRPPGTVHTKHRSG